MNMRSPKYLFLTYSSLLSFSLCTPAISIPPGESQSSPSTEQPQSSNPDRHQILDKRVKKIMQKQHIPGMAVVAIQNGRVQEIKGYGVADIDTKKPVTPETKFPIGSITKPFTAMAIMMLVEEGKVSLDEPISKYLTNLPSQWTAITLRQLMSHTAGISEVVDWGKVKQGADYLKAIKPELDFPPGESWSYSNSGFYLAGLIIERVSGKAYGDFMRDRIFMPLGMQQTQAKLVEIPNLSTGYVVGSKKSQFPLRSRPTPIADDENDSLARANLMEDRYAFSAGNIISTASDMAKWVQALDRSQLLSTASYQQLWTVTPLKNGRSSGYGIGWFVGNFNGHPYTEHSGNVYGHSAGLFRYPKDRLDTIILTNKGLISGVSISNAIADVYNSDVNLFRYQDRHQPDPQPEFTQNFLAFLQAKATDISLAPEFVLQLKTPRSKYWLQQAQKYRKIDKLEFLRVVDRDGDRVYSYQASLNGKPLIMGVTVTAKQQIADYGAIYPAY
jgi:D-alanyl-D-alanine carboxypeptidase